MHHNMKTWQTMFDDATKQWHDTMQPKHPDSTSTSANAATQVYCHLHFCLFIV